MIQDWAGAPTAGGGYRPILQPGYFHFLGSGAWILPDLAQNAKLEVSIKWKNVKRNFVLANSFGTNQTEQRFSTDVEKLESSIFLGGDYKILRAKVKDKFVFVAMRGKWNFTNEEFAALVAKIIGTTREF